MVKPSKVDLFIGDATKAKLKLGWESKTIFEKRIEILLESDLRIKHKRTKS
jgi:GDPmannose 4,6-dehydratase